MDTVDNKISTRTKNRLKVQNTATISESDFKNSFVQRQLLVSAD